jgi:hypothetical protein
VRRATFALLILSGCDNRPDQWDAFVYPDRNDLTVSEKIAGFKTFELCQSAALQRLRSNPEPDSGDYECGYKCEPRADLDGISVCKETRK